MKFYFFPCKKFINLPPDNGSFLNGSSLVMDGELLGELSGKSRYEAHRREDYPAVTAKQSEVETIAYGVPVFIVNSLVDDGIDSILLTLVCRERRSLLGSSGAEKSTLLNSLYGERRSSPTSDAKQMQEPCVPRRSAGKKSTSKCVVAFIASIDLSL